MKLSTIAASASLVLFPILAIAHGGGGLLTHKLITMVAAQTCLS